MSLAIIFRPEALDDLAEAFQWHEEQRSGLGAEFMASFSLVKGAAQLALR